MKLGPSRVGSLDGWRSYALYNALLQHLLRSWSLHSLSTYCPLAYPPSRALATSSVLSTTLLHTALDATILPSKAPSLISNALRSYHFRRSLSSTDASPPHLYQSPLSYPTFLTHPHSLRRLPLPTQSFSHITANTYGNKTQLWAKQECLNWYTSTFYYAVQVTCIHAFMATPSCAWNCDNLTVWSRRIWSISILMRECLNISLLHPAMNLTFRKYIVNRWCEQDKGEKKIPPSRHRNRWHVGLGTTDWSSVKSWIGTDTRQ